MSMSVDVIEGAKKRRCLRRFASVKFTVLLHVDEDGHTMLMLGAALLGSSEHLDELAKVAAVFVDMQQDRELH